MVTAAAAAFAAAGSGCSGGSSTTTTTESDEKSVYCVDDKKRVLDSQSCGYNSVGKKTYFWQASGRHDHAVGSTVGKGDMVSVDDAAGRQRLGLPPTGPVETGIIKRRGIGNDSHGSGGG